jgi:hypothetical protein
MTRKENTASRPPVMIMFSLGFALICCLLCFAEESSGKGNGGPRRVSSALDSYHEVDRVMLPISVFQQPQSGNGVTFSTSPIAVTLADLDMDGPADVSLLPTLPPPGGNDVATPLVGLSADFLIGPAATPVHLNSITDLTMRVRNTNSADTLLATFDTEITALTLAGNDPTFGSIVLRESPTLQSLGHHTLSQSSEGTAVLVNSFFDVFFEICVGGGVFSPADAPFRLALSNPVPQPETITMAAVGIMGLGLFVRRR